MSDKTETDRSESTGTGADPVPVTIYTREDCDLCVVARETVERVAADLAVDVDLETVDVDADRELAEEYGERVPYVFVDGTPAFKYEVDERELRLKLLAAS
ncbi:Glutaredoxin [Halorubrum aquaticum]|uniref:Glutaredoxin n=1 Tax=Halorubrum aquaticum TaxID=387340 RepID=A0A1I2ZUF5_9EURY|nr:glutaredoxin family protein [Halorubrum aquaticum]SFH41245.1 Glutaredoxin [Halorubrum aquaticum]